MVQTFLGYTGISLSVRPSIHVSVFLCVSVLMCLCTLLVVRSGGRGHGNLFTAVANHVAPSQRRGGDMIGHSCEQVSKSPAT